MSAHTFRGTGRCVTLCDDAPVDPGIRRTSRAEPRCTSPDAVDGTKVYLIKNVALMRLTYQIRLLSDAAEQNALEMIIVIPRRGRVSADLESFVAARRWITVTRSH